MGLLALIPLSPNPGNKLLSVGLVPLPDTITANDNELIIFAQIKLGDVWFCDYGLSIFWERQVSFVVEIADAS